MLPENETPSALGLHLRKSRKQLEALDITDAIVRSAIACGATRIEVIAQANLLSFSHDGNTKSIAEIQSGWRDEANSGYYSLGEPYGLELAQILFFASHIAILSGPESVALTLSELQNDARWRVMSWPEHCGMSICAQGVIDPLGFVEDDEGGHQIFRACPIPVFINGVEVERSSQANRDDYYLADGLTVYLHLPSAHLGFSTCLGGTVGFQQKGLSVVFMSANVHRVTLNMEVTVDSIREFKERAAKAFRHAVGQALLKIEAEEGNEYILRHYYPLILRTFPNLAALSEYISTEVFQFPAISASQSEGDVCLLSREMLSQCGNPILCDMPEPDSEGLGLVCAANKLAKLLDAYVLKPQFKIPQQHWIREMAISFKNSKMRVSARGNIITSAALLPGEIKLRVADHVEINLMAPTGQITQVPIYDWVLTEDIPMTRLDALIAQASRKEKVTVLYVNRACTDFICREESLSEIDSRIVTEALECAAMFIRQSEASQS